jgi:hypothetical protein
MSIYEKCIFFSISAAMGSKILTFNFVANALHIDSTGSSKRVLTTNQSTIRIQKNGHVQIAGMYCTNVVSN